MSDLLLDKGVTDRDLTRGRNLRIAGVAAPIGLTATPLILFFLLTVVLSGTPIFAVSSFIIGLVLTIIGFAVGLGFSAYFFHRHKNWATVMRERIAANGIGADEIDWFRKELKPAEKRALKALKARDPLIEDAYRETLASRLTATRIVRSSRKELQAAKRRETKLKSLKTENAKTFLDQLKADTQKMDSIHNEAKQMLIEAESRLEMIEAAGSRGGSLADTEVALKKLASRAAQLPIALEAARIHEESVLEVERSSPDLGDEVSKVLESESNREGRPERMN